MTNPWHQLDVSAIGNPVHVKRREADWVFNFGDTFSLTVEASWRIRDTKMILLTNTDDGQQFGLPAPVDAEKRANEIMVGAVVHAFDYDASTADLKFELSKGLIIEILTNSGGYESWQAYKGGNLLAVGGNGGLR